MAASYVHFYPDNVDRFAVNGVVNPDWTTISFAEAKAQNYEALISKADELCVKEDCLQDGGQPGHLTEAFVQASAKIRSNPDLFSAPMANGKLFPVSAQILYVTVTTPLQDDFNFKAAIEPLLQIINLAKSIETLDEATRHTTITEMSLNPACNQTKDEQGNAIAYVTTEQDWFLKGTCNQAALKTPIITAPVAINSIDTGGPRLKPNEIAFVYSQLLSHIAPYAVSTTFNSDPRDVAQYPASSDPRKSIGNPEQTGLIISAKYDGNTPYSGAVAMNKAMPKTILVTYDGTGHILEKQVMYDKEGAGPCHDIILAYLEHGTLPQHDVECPELTPY